MLLETAPANSILISETQLTHHGSQNRQKGAADDGTIYHQSTNLVKFNHVSEQSQTHTN